MKKLSDYIAMIGGFMIIVILPIQIIEIIWNGFSEFNIKLLLTNFVLILCIMIVRSVTRSM